MKTLIALLLLTATASAQVINTNDWRVQASYPTKIGGLHNPTPDQLRLAGWRSYVPCPVVEGSNVLVVSHHDDGKTVTASCAYVPLPTVAKFADEALDWILLDEHPAPGDIPPAGMTYRLQGNPITWWIVRQNDVLASQLSAHNASGDPVSRTVNLVNGEEEIINLRTLSTANNFAQLRGSRELKTNNAVRARGNPKP